jgi:hypothetical protein
MNIVFYLHPPVDLRPIYPTPIPIDLLSFPTESGEKDNIFRMNYEFFREFFPDATFFTIDPSPKPIFYKMFEDFNILNLPTEMLFPKLFIYSSFIVAHEMNTFTLFFPSYLNIKPFEKFASLFRDLSSDNMLNQGFTFFGSSQDNGHEEYLIPGDLVIKKRSGSFFALDRILMPGSFSMEKQKDPNLRALGPAGIFCFNVVKLMKYFSEASEELQELFFLLVDAWKDKRAVNTVIRDVIGALEDKSFLTMIPKLDDVMVARTDAAFQFIRGLGDFRKYLPSDDNGNFIDGDVFLTHVTNSLVINRGKRQISVDDMNGVCVLADDKDVRIKGV